MSGKSEVKWKRYIGQSDSYGRGSIAEEDEWGEISFRIIYNIKLESQARMATFANFDQSTNTYPKGRIVKCHKSELIVPDVF